MTVGVRPQCDKTLPFEPYRLTDVRRSLNTAKLRYEETAGLASRKAVRDALAELRDVHLEAAWMSSDPVDL